MSIRQITNRSPNYSEICREERNYAAILFSSLCARSNAERFLKLCGVERGIGPDFGIYFEYSYLRDLWNTITDDRTKKEIILRHLPIRGIVDILRLSPAEINQVFGVGGEASTKFIQYPGRWSLIKYHHNFADNDDFVRICRFKWSFNIKPDIVIHIDKNEAICIEAKHESGEGQYPISDREKSLFHERGLKPVGQMELQRYMMNELLGIAARFVFLVSRHQKSDTHTVISWAEAFRSLDTSGMPDFARQMIERISEIRGHQ